MTASMASSLVSATEVSMTYHPGVHRYALFPGAHHRSVYVQHESVYDRCAYAPQRIFEHRKMKVDTRNWLQRPHNISIHNKEEPHTH